MPAMFNAGDEYARYRPTYPREIAPALAELSKEHGCALDVGCGTGQLTELLAPHYSTAVGIDVSHSQVAAATGDAVYAVADASGLPVREKSVDLITVAQAAHWIDLDRFYHQVRASAVPGAAIALVSYGLCIIDDPEVDRVYQEFYYGDFHDYWDARRIHVETGMRDLPFPFDMLDVSCPDIVCTMGVHDFVAYLGTWSATANARSDGHGHLLDEFAAHLELVWGSRQLEVRWPVAVRAGRIAAV